jgi:hypothetical protein
MKLEPLVGSCPSWTSALALGAVLSAALGTAFGVGGCRPLPAKTLTQNALVQIESTSGTPVAGVSVLSEGKRLATSGPDGHARLEIEGHDGDAFRVTVECPDGFLSAEPASFELLVRSADEVAKVPRFESRCAPASLRTTVTLRTNGPNLPVLYRGKEIARTDGAGAATMQLEVPVHEDASFLLDTRTAPKLRPQSPTFAVRPVRGGESFLLEQSFTVEPLKAAPKRALGGARSARVL